MYLKHRSNPDQKEKEHAPAGPPSIRQAKKEEKEKEKKEKPKRKKRVISRGHEQREGKIRKWVNG
jgi:hypothetical protein